MPSQPFRDGVNWRCFLVHVLAALAVLYPRSCCSLLVAWNMCIAKPGYCEGCKPLLLLVARTPEIRTIVCWHGTRHREDTRVQQGSGTAKARPNAAVLASRAHLEHIQLSVSAIAQHLPHHLPYYVLNNNTRTIATMAHRAGAPRNSRTKANVGSCQHLTSRKSSDPPPLFLLPRSNNGEVVCHPSLILHAQSLW